MSDAIFTTFCPRGGCPPTPNTFYYLSVADSYGDGWEGTVLGFAVNGVVKYTFTLTNGLFSNAIPYIFTGFAQVNVVVSTLGTNTEEISFVVKN